MEEEKTKKKDLLKRFLEFAVSIIKLASDLPKNPAGFAISSQIIRSGTSIGANCNEAQDAISRKEFTKTINISLKEARETLYWLELIAMSNLLPSHKTDSLNKECNEIIAILSASVKKLKSSL